MIAAKIPILLAGGKGKRERTAVLGPEVAGTIIIDRICLPDAATAVSGESSIRIFAASLMLAAFTRWARSPSGPITAEKTRLPLLS